MQEFFIGLGIGLVLMVISIIIFSSKVQRLAKELKAETEKYKRMLTDRMELEAEGLKKVKDENEELRKINENLRVSLMVLRDKPGRKELSRLQIMQKAVDRLTLNSPGFAPAWQAALKESEDEFQKVYTGVIPFLRRYIPGKSDAQLIEAQEEESNQ